MEGLGNTACSLECLACLTVHGLDHLGVVTALAQTRFLVASDRSQAARRRSVWILVTSGSLNSNSTRARTSLFPSLCPVVMHSPVTGLFQVLLDRSHHPSPLPRATYDWAYPIGSPFSIAMASDGLLALKRLASTVPVRQQVSGVLLLRPTTRRYEIDLATHRASSARSCSVMRRSADELLLPVTMLYFVML